MTLRTAVGSACLAGYIATIFLANYAVQHIGLVTVWPPSHLQAPAGVWAVGAALVLRDATQWTLGRWVSVLAIPVGAVLSYTVAPSLAVASGAAFLLSESADWLVFQPLQTRGWNIALACSTAVAAAVDSIVFLQLAFHDLSFFRGQLVGKLTMTAAALILCAILRPLYAPAPALREGAEA